MYTGKLTIAKHNGELIEEMRMYHRSEDFKIVKQNEDLVSAFRYATMMRRMGRTIAETDGVGYGPMQYAGKQRGGSGEVQIAADLDIPLW